MAYNYTTGLYDPQPLATNSQTFFQDWAAQQGANASIAGGVGSVGGFNPNFTPMTEANQGNFGVTSLSAPQDDGSFFSGMLGTKDQQGWGGLALGGAGLLANSWLGLQNLGNAKDSLNFQRDAFNRQFDAQRADQAQYRQDRLDTEKAAFA